MANKLNPENLERTIEHLEAWCLAQGLLDAVTGDVTEVDEAEVAQIIGQYEGMVEPEPFVPVVVGEPLFVERRKSLSVS